MVRARPAARHRAGDGVGRAVNAPRPSGGVRVSAPGGPRGQRPEDDARLRAADGERGAGTVLVLCLAAVVLLLGLGLATLGTAQVTRDAAQGAADLAALAGATALRDGLDPCGTAREAAVRNHASLASCDLEDGGIVGVVVTRPMPAVPAWAGGEAGARARAGPRLGPG
ncbi:hypothetical protein ET495_14650 [Xylanimonas allomyrinae]|uniref:Putative Flp pilus-assembly TadG-like N-terminal domain-containing protein n=1 Tax=Xylanimonas allomyrinae TaxID=2509459 RepID=A0A4P6EQV2_9MICO|nr:Rv3654c family TadE-like protein [Xylanimonas allomyrinae]QAY64243.1 hypothetical protein ET495_14650 [Xylanimonas allomyrinae]